MGTRSPSQGLSGGAGAVEFDGVNDHIDAGGNDSIDSITGDLTLSTWIKRSSGVVRDMTIISTHQGLGDFTRPYDLNIFSSLANFRMGNGVAQFSADSTATLVDDTWYHLVGTIEGTAMKMYVDGIQAGTATFSGTRQTGIKVIVGAHSTTGGRIFRGAIDDARIYNRALSAEEIRYLYNNNGPIAHWKFDEGTGTATVFDSAGSNDGTMNGSMTESDWVAGKYGTALDFDGTNDYVSTGTDPLGTNYTSFTMAAWIKTNVTGKQYIIERANTSNDSSILHLNVLGDGKLNADYFSPSGGNLKGNTVVTDGSWHYAVLVQDDTRRSLYLDGVLEATEDPSEAYSGLAPNNLFIGVDKRNTIESSYFDGQIDDVRIYSYARTSDQIRTDYNAGKSIYFR